MPPTASSASIARARPRSWSMTDANGSRLGQEVRPLWRVAVYVPGGRAAYPSTVLMTVVPARVAGVEGDRPRLAARPRQVARPGGAGGGPHRRGDRGLPGRRRAGHRRARLRHRDHPAGGQDRGAREHLRGPRQGPGVRRRRHRHDRRPQRSRGRGGRRAPIPRSWRPTCWPRPSTTRWRARCCSRRRRSSSTRSRARSNVSSSTLPRREIARSALAAHGALVLTASLEEAVAVAE